MEAEERLIQRIKLLLRFSSNKYVFSKFSIARAKQLPIVNSFRPVAIQEHSISKNRQGKAWKIQFSFHQFHALIR